MLLAPISGSLFANDFFKDCIGLLFDIVMDGMKKVKNCGKIHFASRVLSFIRNIHQDAIRQLFFCFWVGYGFIQHELWVIGRV